jgi:extradiol dioxygenase family protein
MRVRPDDELAGTHKPVVHQHLMTDPHIGVIEVLEAEAFGLAARLEVGTVPFDAGRRLHVFQHQEETVRVPDLGRAVWETDLLV